MKTSMQPLQMLFAMSVNVHPGTAKNKMVNSMNIAAQFQLMMPADETPECTDGYQGFYHLKSMNPSVARTELGYIIRDFSREGQEQRKDLYATES